MYLEFLSDGAPDCPLLIFSPAVPKEVEELYHALLNIVADYVTSLEIHGLPYISPVDGCRLTAHIAEQNFGVVLLENTKNHFTWQLTRQTWKEVLDILYPFTRPDFVRSSYNWLNETSNISVLISTMYRRW